MSAPKGLSALAVALLCVAALALALRTGEGLKRPRGPERADGWYSIDPDGLYHTRRVERALREGLPVAERDPYLNHPHGAPIPWPPYYDTLLAAALAPFAPADPEARRPFLERAVATLPVAFGVLTALIGALAAWGLVEGAAWRRAGAAALAGGLAAGGWGAINYSRLGAGDHHAWIGMLHASCLLCASLTLAGRGLRSARLGAAGGALCGVLAGLMLGSWVASLLYVLVLQAVCGWLLLRRAREDLPGAAPFGLAFHLAAGAVILPAVLSSPWKEELPWMVVNLSWFHAAWLAAGAVAFAAPVVAARGALAAGTRAARAYPLGVVVAALAIAGLGWLADAAPARGIAEGFAWVSRADAFMDSVRESAPLLGPRAPAGELFLALGFGVLALPFVWGAGLWRALAGRADALLPWVAVTPLVLGQALVQKRFSDAVMAPMAVLLAWGATRLFARLPAAAAVPVGLALALVLGSPSVRKAAATHDPAPRAALAGPNDASLGERTAIEWIRRQDARGAVLAHWDRGHVIEWAADRPSVGTNFGSYVGADAYRDPARFFLGTDPDAARALLEARGVSFVLVPVTMPVYTDSMLRILDLPREEYLGTGPGGRPTPTARWRRTMLSRLISNGAVPIPAGADATPEVLDFLRLVHASTRVNPAYVDGATGAARPAAFVWQHVAGALVERACPAGSRLEVELDVAYPPARHGLRWAGSATADADGIARLRVPYATEGANGDGRVQRAVWKLGEDGGDLRIPARAVLDGGTVVLP